MAAWCHIYLGRILDLQGERESAVAQYKAALDMSDAPGRYENCGRAWAEGAISAADGQAARAIAYGITREDRRLPYQKGRIHEIRSNYGGSYLGRKLWPWRQTNPDSQTQLRPPRRSAKQRNRPGARRCSTPAPRRSKVLQAKSQEEMKAYQDAFAKTDPAQAGSAADDFAAKYPNSELRASLYIRAMNLYGQANNTEKVIDDGRKAIAADPTNPIPLVQVASA